MPAHRCDLHLLTDGLGNPGPLTISRCLRLLLAYDDDISGDADSVSAEIAGCARCAYGVAMGATGMAVSFMHTVVAERGEDPRPALELHLAAALDQIAAEEAGG